MVHHNTKYKGDRSQQTLCFPRLECPPIESKFSTGKGSTLNWVLAGSNGMWFVAISHGFAQFDKKKYVNWILYFVFIIWRNNEFKFLPQVELKKPTNEIWHLKYLRFRQHVFTFFFIFWLLLTNHSFYWMSIKDKSSDFDKTSLNKKNGQKIKFIKFWRLYFWKWWCALHRSRCALMIWQLKMHRCVKCVFDYKDEHHIKVCLHEGAS